MHNKAVLIVGLAMLGIGSGMTLWAALKSREATGEWFGYGAPTGVLAIGGGGMLLAAFGVLVCAAYGILAFAEWSGLRKKLETQVLPDSHPLARIGRGVLRINHIWHVFTALLLLAFLVFAMLQSFVGAVILFGLLSGAYLLWHMLRSRSERSS